MSVLSEFYGSEKDIPYYMIPSEYKSSFDSFMFGRLCSIDDDGVLYAYYSDYDEWYLKMKIERNIKIDNILDGRD